MASQQRIADVFVELADTLVAGFDVIDFLHTLTDASVELLRVDAAGLVLQDQRGDLQVIASSSEESRLLELFELQHDEGPCLDCFTSGAQVVNVSPAQARERWPRFAAAAAAEGFISVHALPLRLRQQVIGAINLFLCQEIALDEQDVALGQGLADVATIGLLQERAVREHHVLAEQLQGALNSRVLIEQAKGVLAERAGLTMPEAFAVMRSYARRRGLPLNGIAAGVVEDTIDIGELQHS